MRHGVASRVVLLEGESRSDDGGDVERGHIVHLRHGLGCGCIIAATALQMTRCIIDSHGSLASAKDQPDLHIDRADNGRIALPLPTMSDQASHLARCVASSRSSVRSHRRREAKGLHQGLKELLKTHNPWDKEVEFSRKK